MDDQQARELYRRIFVSAPDLLPWVQDKSPDAAATLANWRSMLKRVPVEIGNRVVSQIESGDREMPKMYDRGEFGRLLKSWCMKIVDTDRRKSAEEHIRSEGRREKTDMASDPGLFAAYRKSVAAAEEFRAGRIDEAENRRRVLLAQWDMPHNDRHRNNGMTFEKWCESKDREPSYA